MVDLHEELSIEERDGMIERIAEGIVKRGMETPAILFLEMHKPLSFVASQGMIVAGPLVAPLVGLGNLESTRKLLEDRQNVERLLCRIEELAEQKSAGCRGVGANIPRDTERV